MYEIVKRDGKEAQIKIVLKAEEWKAYIEKAYQANKSKFNIQGFRKGNAPKSIIEKNYGEGVFYDDALDMARHAMQFGKIEVILWHQGESDAKFKTPDYKEKLITVINNFRRDLGLEHVPVILGGLGTFLDPERFAARDEYNELIRQAAAELPNAGFVSAEGLNHRGDNLHFDTPSQYELARRYFNEYCKLTNQI